MEPVSALAAAFCLALACNLDTVLLAAGYGARGTAISPVHSLVLAAVTTAVTWLSLVLGDRAGAVLSAPAAGVLGGLAIGAIGCWFLLDYLRGRGGEPEGPASPGLGGWVSLAAALAVNNAGVGVAAGTAGISAPLAALANFLVTLAALPLGRRLGAGLAGRLLGKYALPLSGALLIALGAWRVLVPEG